MSVDRDTATKHELVELTVRIEQYKQRWDEDQAILDALLRVLDLLDNRLAALERESRD